MYFHSVNYRVLWYSAVDSSAIWGAKIFDFRRITLFCLDKRFSKHKMTIFSKNLGGLWPLWPPLGYAYAFISTPGHHKNRRQSRSRGATSMWWNIDSISATNATIGVRECIILGMQKIFAQIWSCFSPITYKQHALMLRLKCSIVNKSRFLHA